MTRFVMLPLVWCHEVVTGHSYMLESNTWSGMMLLSMAEVMASRPWTTPPPADIVYLSQPAWNRYGLGLNWYYELSFNILLKGIVICRQFVRDFWNIFRFLLFCLSLTGRQSHASNSTRSCLLLSVLCFSFLLSTLPSLTACVPLSPSLPTLSFLLDVAWALIWV